MTGITRMPGMTRLQGVGGGGSGGLYFFLNKKFPGIFFQGHISHFSRIPIRDLSL